MVHTIPCDTQTTMMAYGVLITSCTGWCYHYMAIVVVDICRHVYRFSALFYSIVNLKQLRLPEYDMWIISVAGVYSSICFACGVCDVWRCEVNLFSVFNLIYWIKYVSNRMHCMENPFEWLRWWRRIVAVAPPMNLDGRRLRCDEHDCSMEQRKLSHI